MNLLERLAADLKTAMIGRDAVATTSLRMLKAELQNTAISAGHDLSEEEILQVIRREVKKRKEAATTFRAGGSEERALQEESEVALLEQYLPAQADPAVVEEYVRSLISTTPNKGDIIRQTLAHFAGTADGKMVAELVNKLAE